MFSMIYHIYIDERKYRTPVHFIGEFLFTFALDTVKEGESKSCLRIGLVDLLHRLLPRLEHLLDLLPQEVDVPL